MSKPNITASSLNALAEAKTDGIQKQTTFKVDPNLVAFEEGFNLRANDDTVAAHIDRLYEAMKNGAAIPAIDVRVEAGKIIAIDGHCRTIAARRVKKEHPEFMLEARQFRGDEQERLLHMLGTGSGQKPLSPLEQGVGFLRLVKYGMTSTQIATKLGVSRVTVDNGLILAEAPHEVQKLVRDGAVSSTTARDAVKAGPEGVKALKIAAAKEASQPATKSGKTSTKKKVTAKILRGTAADKTTAKKKPAKKKEVTPAPTSTTKEKKIFDASGALLGVMNDGEIMILVKKDQASNVAEFLRANAPEEDSRLKDFAATLEMACM